MKENINLESQNLISCTFKTTPYNKFQLVQRARENGQTLSQEISDLLTFSLDNENVRETTETKIKKLFEKIAGNNPNEMKKLVKLWKEL